MLARGSILVCMGEDKKSEGRYGVRRKPKDDYQMKAADFDKMMEKALKVPPMPVKQKERVVKE